MTWLCIKGQGGRGTRGEEREEERGMGRREAGRRRRTLASGGGATGARVWGGASNGRER